VELDTDHPPVTGRLHSLHHSVFGKCAGPQRRGELCDRLVVEAVDHELISAQDSPEPTPSFGPDQVAEEIAFSLAQMADLRRALTG
jgi:hypothetical protein